MSGRYGAATSVTVERSKTEIEKLLGKHGATRFGTMTDYGAGVAQVHFVFYERPYQIEVPLPSVADDDVRLTETGKRREGAALTNALAQGERQRWRAIWLLCRALLEAVATDAISIEDAFLPFAVLPDGQTVANALKPQFARAIEAGAYKMLGG
jgi:hypothetical protein